MKGTLTNCQKESCGGGSGGGGGGGVDNDTVLRYTKGNFTLYLWLLLRG